MGGNTTKNNNENCKQYDLSDAEIERMQYEGVTVEDGCLIEPDNVCPHGLPGPLAERYYFGDAGNTSKPLKK